MAGTRKALASANLTLNRWQARFDPGEQTDPHPPAEVGVAMRSAGRWEDALRLNAETLELLKNHYGDNDEVYLNVPQLRP